MKALLLALKKAKGKGSASSLEGDDAGPELDESGPGDDYKQVAKDALKDGDWDAAVDALCSYFEQDKD